MKIKEIIKEGIYVLKERNVSESNLKARMLLAFLLKQSKEYLITHDTDEISFEQQKEYYGYLDLLISGKPIQYITKTQEFMGLNFYVDENVLIPQPDTEILVQATQKFINTVLTRKENHKLFDDIVKKPIKVPKILDLCTGSGAIAISLAKTLANVKVFASDISKEALMIAKKNALNNKANVNFIESDLFENINDKFDIIVSNPPYIETNVIPTLEKEVREEPILALDGGIDGLDFYRKIAKEAVTKLNPEGMLFLEIGYNQKINVIRILKNEKYKIIKTLKDFGENDRVIIASK